MARKELKGLTIKIGGDTSDLAKSLDKVDNQSRKISSELGEINKLLKLDPKNTELLAQKQKVLADAIGSTEKKLDTLKEAEKQVQAQFERGEVSEAQYRALQREIIETENKLDKYKNAAKEAADAVEALGKEAGKAADKLDEQADKTKEADKASEDLNESTGDLAAGGLAAAAAAAAAAVTAIVALAEESREYRTEMGKLDTAFKDNKFSAETATKTYESLQSVLGETEQAVEASNNLAALCDTEEALSDWTKILTGVYGKFGASLPVEGLAEAANETRRVGQVTGPLADALNWAAKEGETFGVTLKKNTKENKEWNEAVTSAASAEDYFNLALQKCSTEQERQQLITQTLTKLYGSAAEQYKKTNAEVIRANQATEKWNKVTAKTGKTVEPVVTDIKELGAVLLEDASEPLEETAEYIRKDVLPAIEKAGKWVKKNMPVIKSGLVGVAAAMVAFKAASIAVTVAQKGLKGAIMATTVAQKALTLAQAATPWGIIATAVVGVTAAVVALSKATKDARQPTEFLTQEERELMQASKDAAAAFRDQQKATQESLSGILSEMDYASDLADELDRLVDMKGKVRKEDETRVKSILGQLNDMLGTEYELTGGLVTNYKELKSSIQDVIAQKTANLLLDEANEDYLAAIHGEAKAWEARNLAQKQYDAQLELSMQAAADYEAFAAEFERNVESGYYNLCEAARIADAARKEELKGLAADEEGYLDDRARELREAIAEYNLYSDQIIKYRQAQEAAAAGNYETVRQLLDGISSVYSEHADTAEAEMDRTLNALEKEVQDASRNAELTKEAFKNGVAGYTEEMVKEAEEGYNEALGKWASAYSDAHGLGEDFGQGLADGIISMNEVVGGAAIAQIREAIAAAKKAAAINSPSKKTMKIGEGLGKGEAVGIKKTTKDVRKAATDQMAAVLDAYGYKDRNAQRSLRNVAESQAARQVAGQMVAATANSGALEQILAAIKEGQVLLLDGAAVVGGTANRMDSKLGQLRVLAARGAR